VAEAVRTPLSGFQLLIAAICFLVMLADGYDTQVVAFAAPVLLPELGGDHSRLGMVFGAGLFGGLIGGLLLGPLGDRIGRKPILVASMTIVAVGSFATALANTAEQLALLRLLTGVGLGGAIPSVIALSSEYAPARWRSTIVACVFSGFPLGAVAGSIISAEMLPVWGWRGLFVLGAVAPLILLLPILFALPESLHVLRRGTGREARIARIIARLGPDAAAELERNTGHHGAPRDQRPVRSLFTEQRAAATLLIWFVSFVCMLSIYCIVNWLPTLIRGAGLPLDTAVLAIGAINIGSVIGNLAIARLADRFPPYLLTASSFVAGALFLGLVGRATGSSELMLFVCFLAGLLAIGAQLSIIPLIARFYPAGIRATGIGWSFGIGRFGGVLGPTVAGVFLSLGLSFANLMLTVAGLIFLAGVAVFLLGRVAPVLGQPNRESSSAH
jgi:AAHS family 4-hydroxybenzoate transporter-like MFS transporter